MCQKGNLENSSVEEKMSLLISKLNHAAMAYEQLDNPIMEDIEYDRLYDQLRELEESAGIILPGSPTQKVGYEVVSLLSKVRHDIPMLSLDKTKEVSALVNFLAAGNGLLSWKLDGLTIVLKYKNGKLLQAITRGNGEIGEDITHNAKVFQSLPKSIPYKGELSLRGEAVISFSEFERINEELAGGEPYKNPRNLCSGTVRQLNSQITAQRNVDFFGFSLISAEDVIFQRKSQELKFLREQGFLIVAYEEVNAGNIEEAVESFKKKVESMDYASDGLVLTYDDLAFSRSLGSTNKFPRDSIAFKWADEQAETTLLRIQWNTSRTGLINPVAEFEPVTLEGTEVERAGLHNLSIVEGLRLGTGDRILVYKANMIIPQIAENLTQSGPGAPPENCPACDGPAEIHDVNDVKTLHCVNLHCIAKHIEGLVHFVSRDAMNIEGLSKQTLIKFIDEGFIKTPPDIFRLGEYGEKIAELRGFGQKSLDRLLASIERARNVALPNLLYALGIDNVGLAGAKLLCRHMDLDGDINKIMTAGYEQLLEIEGFGPIIAESVTAYFQDKGNVNMLHDLLGEIRIHKPEPQERPASGQGIAGKTFVITGDTEIYQNRRELTRVIEAGGGKVSASVSAKTDYLINNDAASSSSKNKKARELNIPIISEEEFTRLMDQPSVENEF